MALIEMFYGDVERQREPLTNVLNQGLLAAEGKESSVWAGSDDLRIQFLHEGNIYPEWLDRVNPELATIYKEWVEENRSRIEAVLKCTE